MHNNSKPHTPLYTNTWLSRVLPSPKSFCNGEFKTYIYVEIHADIWILSFFSMLLHFFRPVLSTERQNTQISCRKVKLALKVSHKTIVKETIIQSFTFIFVYSHMRLFCNIYVHLFCDVSVH
jgi:hypothetical protein